MHSDLAEHAEFNSFNTLCLQAVQCSDCFQSGFVRRAYLDIAQPRYVGPGYWTSEQRLLFLMINPGAGHGSKSDVIMRQEIQDFRQKKIGLQDLFIRQRAHMNEWGQYGKFLKFFSGIGVDVDEVAFLNIAWCASQGDFYPAAMLNACFEKYTRNAIDYLQPSRIVACGSKAQEFAFRVQLPFTPIPHYADRRPIDFDGVRRKLQISKQTKAQQVEVRTVSRIENAGSAGSFAPYDIIHLLSTQNPKIGKSALRFDCYRKTMTVSEYEDAVRTRLGAYEGGKCKADLRWDIQRGFIRIEKRR